MEQPRYRHLDILINIFVVVLIISNLMGSKSAPLGLFVLVARNYCSP